VGVRRRVGEDLADEHFGDVREARFPGELQDLSSPVPQRPDIQSSLRVGAGQPVKRRQQPAPVLGLLSSHGGRRRLRGRRCAVVPVALITRTGPGDLLADILDGTSGMTEASITRSPLTPLTAPAESTTAHGSPGPPIGAVEVG
jgi:hypothetical protein